MKDILIAFSLLKIFSAHGWHFSWFYEADEKKSDPIILYQDNPIKSFRRTWKQTLRRAGLTRRIRSYDMRHNMITLALEKGAAIKALAEVVGSRPETIMKYYQHVKKTAPQDRG